MMKYQVSVTLLKEYEAFDTDAAFGMMLDDIRNRDGMEIVSHEIIPIPEDENDGCL